MTTEEFKDQIEALRRATSKACQSKEFAITRGWRATPNNVYCPICAKIKLKIQ